MSDNSRNRIMLASYVIAVLFALFAIRLWQLQILQGEEYRKISTENMLRIIKIPAPRGIIYDRNGVPLVKNSPYFYAALMPENLKQVNVQYLADILGINAGDIYARINKKGLSRFEPIKLKEGLTFKEIAAIEARRSDFPGLIIDIDMSREYLYGDIGAHLIGYLGKLNPSQSKNPEFKDVPPEAFIGQWGAELIFDRSLRGIPGERIIEIDALGREIKLLQENPPVKGEDLKLSIDINLQKAAEEAFAGRAGAVVALKPDTGEILGLVSRPSFDPNLFARGINYSQWAALIQDKKKPMLNRAVQSQYPPGSIFKIITAIAALEEGVIHPDTKINCTGSVNYGGQTFGCWKKEGHGHVDFHKAFVESCDVYYYEIGKRLGIDKIYKYAAAFGLGKETGIEMATAKERRGLIPNTEWKKKNKRQRWYLGDTFISAMGQGFVTATPIQMAVMTATFANGGNIYKPSLIKINQAPSGTVTLKPETVRIMKKALWGAVNEPNGTGQRAKSALTVIGGKTGTAQVVGKGKNLTGEQFMNHAWFVAFAPMDNPEIAVSVFVEHGGGGGAVAAPIAKLAIEAYLKSKQNSRAEAQQ